MKLIYINSSDSLISARQQKWDMRFLEISRVVAAWSKDPSTKVGAVITRPDNTVVSVGFNGFPRFMEDVPANYENRDEKYSRIIHGEINAAIHAREPLTGCTVYTSAFAPCDRCAVQLLQAGAIRFVFPALPEGKERWLEAINRTKKYIEDCYGVWTEYNVPL